MLAELSIEEKEIVKKSILHAMTVLGWDYETRIGIKKESAEEILKTWPVIDDESDESESAIVINNSMNDLLYGVGLPDDEILEKIGCNKNEMASVYKKWASHRGWRSTGVR